MKHKHKRITKPQTINVCPRMSLRVEPDDHQTQDNLSVVQGEVERMWGKPKKTAAIKYALAYVANMIRRRG